MAGDVVHQRFLVCTPDYFDSTFFANPWMDYTESVDQFRARTQWDSMVRAIEEAGAQVELLAPSIHSPAQVFTADGAIVLDGTHVLVLRNDGARGTLEPRNFADWFSANGYEVESIPPNRSLDGGNIIRLHDGSFGCGLKPGADLASVSYFKKIAQLIDGRQVHAVSLVDRKYLHIDMTIGRIGDSGYLVFEQGLEGGLDALDGTPILDSQIIKVGPEDAERFACNGITIGDSYLTGMISRPLVDAIERLGYRSVTLELDEFHKAGGGLKCLTLPLDPAPVASN
jgi:N-dimethylarginine dimethylaminohydrolase